MQLSTRQFTEFINKSTPLSDIYRLKTFSVKLRPYSKCISVSRMLAVNLKSQYGTNKKTFYLLIPKHKSISSYHNPPNRSTGLTALGEETRASTSFKTQSTFLLVHWVMGSYMTPQGMTMLSQTPWNFAGFLLPYICQDCGDLLKSVPECFPLYLRHTNSGEKQNKT